MSLEANPKKLPKACYTVSELGDLVMLHRNQSGYHISELSSPDDTANRILADQLNAALGVTKAQEQAMYAGSLFGWEIPGADPDRYTEQGILKGVPESLALSDDERAYSLNDGELYLHIQTYEDGYDYTIYCRDFSEHDGGQLDEPDVSMDEAVHDILECFGMQDLSRQNYDLDQLLCSVDEVAAAQLAEARAAHGIPSLGEQIAGAQDRSVTQHQDRGEGPRRVPERS